MNANRLYPKLFECVFRQNIRKESYPVHINPLRRRQQQQQQQWRRAYSSRNQRILTPPQTREQERISALQSLYEIEKLSRRSAPKDEYLPIWNKESQIGIRVHEYNDDANAQQQTTAAATKRLSISVDGEVIKFDVTFLRDACSCPACVDPSTQQKLFQTSDIPTEITVRQKPVITSEGNVRIHWTNDIPGYTAEHVTELGRDFFRRYSSLRNRVRSRYNDPRYVLWDGRIMNADLRWFTYNDYMANDKTLYEVLKQLTCYGLVFIKGVPNHETSIERLGSRIGPLKNTFYGRVWNVRSIPDAKNIAYTNKDLGFHMDLLYFASPPGLQFLHCLRNDAKGGESLFADTFHAATLVRLNSRMLWDSLRTFPVTYHYVNDNQHYHFTRPTIELEKYSHRNTPPRVAHVNWSPPFQAPFEADIGDKDYGSEFRRYLAAAKSFAAHLEARSARFQLRLEPGQCVVFNNRRVVHARRAFELEDGGERWLRGAYVDTDAWMSRWRVLSGVFDSVSGSGLGVSSDEDDYEFGFGGGAGGRRAGGDEYI